MADPLTSSDIIRESMGFGPSSPEEKRRAAGAGISPLGTMERQRFERGGGLSPMASESEKEAWVAAEVQAGRRDPMELPKAYGGLGERPEATTRRGIRMQQDWDKRYEMMLAEQEAARRQENDAKDYEFKIRDQRLQEDDYYYKRGLLEAEQKLKAQQTAEAKEFIGSVNSLDPRSPEYRDQLIELRKKYPLGTLDPTANSLIGEYDKVHSVYMDAEKETRSDQKQEQDWRVQQEAMASELGISVDEFKDAETGEINRVGLMQRVGEERRKQKEENEKRAQDVKLDAEKRTAVTSLNREIRDIDDELDSAEALARSAKGSVKKEAMQNVDILNKRRSRRQEELQLIYGETEEAQPELPTKSEVDAARTFIRNNPDSPQVEQMRAIIERFEGGGEQPAQQGEETQAPATQAAPAQTAAQPATSPPFLSGEQLESIPETRREFATGKMAENLDTMEQLNTELDRLYKVRFTSKGNMEKYKSLEKQLSAKRKEDTKLRTARRKEIREEMKKLGPYGSGEERRKYTALQRELQLLTGV